MEAGSPKVSVIVSTYNRPEALKLVLEGYARSTFRDFEVVVADDGSAEETARAVDDFASRSPFPITRAFQPHHGFRLAHARNLAVRASRGEILVFTDGDCIPFPDSLEPHAERCAPRKAQAGSRSLLSEDETKSLLSGALSASDFFEPVRRREKARLRGLWWKNRIYAWTRWKARPKLQTSNAAVHRSDFERVNGFDERFVGWGYEDEDLARRLRRAKVRILDGSRESLLLHLFHPVHESHRPHARSGENYRYYRRNRFLMRPLQGLCSRKVEELSLELVGEVPETLRSTLFKAGAPPEVTLVFGRRRHLPRSTRGELTIHVPESSHLSSLGDLHRLLLENL
jgi:glycosyltransferase involved in cell wall biosynthesis